MLASDETLLLIDLFIYSHAIEFKTDKVLLVYTYMYNNGMRGDKQKGTTTFFWARED